MDTGTLVIGLVGLILGAGGVGSLVPILRFRADRGNVIAVGSEAAVQSLTVALQRSDQRVTHLEEDNHNLRVNVNDLTATVSALKSKLEQCERQIERLTSKE